MHTLQAYVSMYTISGIDFIQLNSFYIQTGINLCHFLKHAVNMLNSNKTLNTEILIITLTFNQNCITRILNVQKGFVQTANSEDPDQNAHPQEQPDLSKEFLPRP